MKNLENFDRRYDLAFSLRRSQGSSKGNTGPSPNILKIFKKRSARQNYLWDSYTNGEKQGWNNLNLDT